MKKKIILPILFILSLFIKGCLKEEYVLKGLVSFSKPPVLVNDMIQFAAQIQFDQSAFPVKIEYNVLNGNEIVFTSSSLAGEDINDTGLFYQTSTIIFKNEDMISGDTITIWLDPQNKLTDEGYTNEFNINIWKKEYLIIP